MSAVWGMTAGAVSNETMTWHDIEWEKVHRNVRRLQARIVKATRDRFTTGVSLLGNRVLSRKAFEMLELCEGRLSRTVLRGRGVSNGSLLPDRGPL
jgi:hypothetical protein